MLVCLCFVCAWFYVVQLSVLVIVVVASGLCLVVSSLFLVVIFVCYVVVRVVFSYFCVLE